MASAVSKATIKSNVWENFYDTINAEIADPLIATRSKWIYSTYPSSLDISSAVVRDSDYPLIVVESPKVNWEKLTLGKNWAKFTIEIELYHTSAVNSDVVADQIMDAIETNKDDLAAKKIQMIYLDSTDRDIFFRGKVKVHVTSMIFSGQVGFRKTTGF